VRIIEGVRALESRVLAERKPVALKVEAERTLFESTMRGLDVDLTRNECGYRCGATQAAFNGWLYCVEHRVTHPTPDDASVSVATLFEVLMQQNIVTSDESYLSLRCVGVPPTEEEFVQAVRRTIDAAIDRARQSGEEGK
jgi:hypothetical protein